MNLQKQLILLNDKSKLTRNKTISTIASIIINNALNINDDEINVRLYI